MIGTWKRGYGRFAPIVAIGAVVILVAAPNASGQSALDQYVPTGNPAGGNKGGGSLDSPVIPQAPGGASAAHTPRFHTGTGTDKGGKLPLTDYPSTPFIWIVIAILVTAGLIRIAVAVKNRKGTALETG
jgi:hypothetical protein